MSYGKKRQLGDFLTEQEFMEIVEAVGAKDPLDPESSKVVKAFLNETERAKSLVEKGVDPDYLAYVICGKLAGIA